MKFIVRWSLLILIAAGLILEYSWDAEACRMWGMVSEAMPAEVLEEHLNAFREFSIQNPNGWGIGYFFNEQGSCQFYHPILRRGGPPAYVDDDYDLVVHEMMSCSPRAAIAHVRRANSGAVGIPGPHPFCKFGKWLFAHNGSVNSDVLRDLIGKGYLLKHPPDYTQPENIDSELLFIYILKVIYSQEWPSIEEAIKHAISYLDMKLHSNGDDSKLTFLLMMGSYLWACRYADVRQHDYTLYYTSPVPNMKCHWAVASEPVSNENWRLVPMYNLVTFQPHKNPIYTEIPNVQSFGSDIEAPVTQRTGQNTGQPSAKLYKNYPDPCNPATWIPYEITQDAVRVTVSIYSVNGQLVRTLHLGTKRRGLYLTKEEAAYWDGKNETGQAVGTGVYFYKFEADGYSVTGKAIVIR